MELNEVFFNQQLVNHKKGIAHIDFLAKDLTLKELSSIHHLDKESTRGKELALVLAEFRCQICKTEENLTWHHVYDRRYERFLSPRRYITSKIYWSNILILCNSCHNKWHGDMFGTKHIKPIGVDRINRIKNKYLKIKKSKEMAKKAL